MKSPIRLMQLEKDYQRHKLLRRIKKRRKRLAESAQKLAERWFLRKIRRPSYAEGKDDDVIRTNGDFYIEPVLPQDIGIDPETGDYVNNKTHTRGGLMLPEVVINWDRLKNRAMTPDEVTADFYRKHIPYSSAFDGSLITAPTDWAIEKVIGPAFNTLLSGFANYGTTPQQLSNPDYLAFMLDLTQRLGEGLSYTLPSRYLDTGNATLNFTMDMLAGKYAPKAFKYIGNKLRKPTIGPSRYYDYDYELPPERLAEEPNIVLDNIPKNVRRTLERVYFGQSPETALPLPYRPAKEGGLVGTRTPFSQEVVDIVNHDIVPRLMRDAKTGAEYPEVMQKNIQDTVDRIIREGYFYPTEEQWNSVWNNPNQLFKGVYLPDYDEILLRPGESETHILPHEIRHKIEESLGLKNSEKALLEAAYDQHFLNQNRQMGNGKEYDATPERSTTNGDVRRELFKQVMLDRFKANKSATRVENIPTDMDLQNLIIDDATLDLIDAALEFANPYSSNYYYFLHNNRLLTPQKYNQIRLAMKMVGGVVTPVALLNMLDQLNSLNGTSYNRGKGIYINPKNRGKFNATKKRTGKTTEQLTHSKNPLTRKRAIFAQNAKKWKHK